MSSFILATVGSHGIRVSVVKYKNSWQVYRDCTSTFLPNFFQTMRFNGCCCGSNEMIVDFVKRKICFQTADFRHNALITGIASNHRSFYTNHNQRV